MTPSDIAPPAANYHHGMVSSAGSRLLHTSGVVPTRPDGTTPVAIGEQAEVVWANIQAILAAADMTVRDIVSITTYVVAGHGLGPVMAARDVALAGHTAASTLLTVPALARPEWQMEIQVIAAAD